MDNPSKTSAEAQIPPGLDSPPKELRSGLKNPGAAIRGVAAGTLVLEALALLLALAPLRQIANLSGAGLAVIVGLVTCSVVLCGLMRYSWAWFAGTVLQAAVIGSGFIHWSLAVVGILFGAIWWYVMRVRRFINMPVTSNCFSQPKQSARLPE